MKKTIIEDKLKEIAPHELLRKHFTHVMTLSTTKEQCAYWEEVKMELANQPAEVQAEFFQMVEESRQLLKKSLDNLYEKMMSRKKDNAA